MESDNVADEDYDADLSSSEDDAQQVPGERYDDDNCIVYFSVRWKTIETQLSVSQK